MKERERENPKWLIQREKIWNLCETNETAMHREGKGVGWLISPEEETLSLWINVSIDTDGNLWQCLLKQELIGNHINTSPWK